MFRNLALVAALCLPGVASAVTEPFQDAFNRVWYLSYPRGQRFEDMAARFDPLTGNALDRSGLRWATANEVGELHSEIGAQEFFSRYDCTYGRTTCRPVLSMWTENPGYGPEPSGAAVFGGVVREPIRMGQFLGGPEQPLQMNIYFGYTWELLGYGGPQEDWALAYGPLVSGGASIPLDGEVSMDGMWIYRFVPAPGTLVLAVLGLCGILHQFRRVQASGLVGGPEVNSA